MEISPISGKATFDAAYTENAFGKRVMCLRLPGWLDENLRAAAQESDISPQAFIRYLLTAAVGGPDEHYLDRLIQAAEADK